eukprot:m.36943 g.36943  ORF g.36943 m.36943 type:complete len:330 (-) comp11480_c0_seq1:365-1354(-)
MHDKMEKYNRHQNGFRAHLHLSLCTANDGHSPAPSQARSTRGDGPDLLDHTVAEAQKLGVHVHRRVAVAGNQQQLVADPEFGGRLGRREEDLAVLVAAVLVDSLCPHPAAEVCHEGRPAVQRVGLHSCVDDDEALGRSRGDDGGEHIERLPEVAHIVAVGIVVLAVVGVHKDVGACLALGVDASLGLEKIAARASAGNFRHVDARRLEGVSALCREVRHVAHDLLALRLRADVLGAAVVAVQAAKDERGLRRDGVRQRHHVAGVGVGLDAAPVLPNVDLNEDCEDDATVSCGLGVLRDMLQVICEHRDVDAGADQSDEAVDLGALDNLV